MMKLGILGGGQLAKMMALAAYPLGIQVKCLDPVRDCCAGQVTEVLHAKFMDDEKIDHFFSDVDCISFETENLPIEFVRAIAKKHTLYPGINALKTTQDRLFEKKLFNELDIPTALYAQIDSWEDLKQTLQAYLFPVILKTRRNGYDGKGQALINNWQEAEEAWQNLSSHALIVEKFIPFTFEVSLISVRDKTGNVSFYPLVLNEHKEGILRLSQAPCHYQALQEEAESYALAILQKFNYVGVMTIEFFFLQDRLIANEIAPRVHNSGHWTIEGAQTSQFENHIRAIAGLPLGSTEARGYSAMINNVGSEPSIANMLTIPGLHYHTYGKAARERRKLGHLTLCADSQEELRQRLEACQQMLNPKNDN